jgi:hypothetical protein
MAGSGDSGADHHGNGLLFAVVYDELFRKYCSGDTEVTGFLV